MFTFIDEILNFKLFIMKKITLLAALLVAFYSNAQIETSFETGEGFTVGALNGQNGWANTTGADANFSITTDQATDGTQSLQLIPTNGQSNLVALGPTITSSADVVVFTVDAFIEAAPTGGENSDVQVITQSPSQELVTARVNFDFQGNVSVLDDDGTGTETLAFIPAGTFVRNAFFEFKIEHRFADNEILYYIDDSLIYTGEAFGATNVESAVFLFDNFESGAYFDNLTYAENPLAVEEFAALNFTQFVDSNNTLYMSSNEVLESVELYNVLGKQVKTMKLASQEAQVSLADLSSGIYLAKVTVNGQNKSFKLIKK